MFLLQKVASTLISFTRVKLKYKPNFSIKKKKLICKLYFFNMENVDDFLTKR